VGGAGQQLAHHLRVERRAARPDPFQRVQELPDLRHPVLEQVADAPAVVADQLRGVPALDVLRQHEHPDLRPPAPDFQCRDHALVTMAGRHPHVDHDDVGLLPLEGAEQRSGVANRSYDLVALLDEQADEAFPQQR
jgi:hypothetical protein